MLVEFANLSPDNEMLRNNTNNTEILQINSKFFFTWWNFTPGFDTEGFLNVWKRHQFHQMLWIYLDEQKYFDPVHSILNSNLPFTDYLTHSIYSLSLASIPRIKSCKINKKKHSTKRIFHSSKRQFTDGFASMEMGVSWNHRMLTTSRNLFGPEIFSYFNSFANISSFLLVSTTVDDQSDCHDWRYSKTKTNQHELIELCLLQTLINLHEITEDCPRDS